jgi:hypothetical protein
MVCQAKVLSFTASALARTVSISPLGKRRQPYGKFHMRESFRFFVAQTQHSRAVFARAAASFRNINKPAFRYPEKQAYIGRVRSPI